MANKKLSKAQIDVLEMMSGLWFMKETPEARTLRHCISGYSVKVRPATFTALLEGGYIEYKGNDIELTGKYLRVENIVKLPERESKA